MSAALHPRPDSTAPPAPAFDVEHVLADIDRMSAARPVAAQVVSLAGSEDVSAAELARVLGADVTLGSRVVKLANSAFFGMRGRVSSLQFAVTVVGFTTVRTMATVALTDLADRPGPPESSWRTAIRTALAASVLAGRFGHRQQDALCLGLLAQLGAALLAHQDPEGYADLVAGHVSPTARRRAEVSRYGVHASWLSAVALETWGFPSVMVTAVRGVDDPADPEGGLLRAAQEVAARLEEGHTPEPVGALTGGRLREDDVAAVLPQVEAEGDELLRALLD